MSARRRLTVLALGATLVVGLNALPAQAASLKAIQTGTVTMSSTTRTATLSPSVDASKSFVVCTNLTNSSNPTNRVTCELSDTTVTVTSSASNSSEEVRWHVVEFEGGVSVQRGATTIGSSSGTVNQSISSVDLAKSFVLTTERADSTSTNVDERWTVRARLTSSTNLQLTRNDDGFSVTIAWQVVQMEGASVQRGTRTMSGTSATDSISSVDPATSFLLLTSRASSGVDGIEERYQVTGEITSSTGLTFRRDSTDSSVDIAWEVVSLSDGGSVQAGEATASSTQTSLNAGLSPAVDLARSVPFVSVRGGIGDEIDLDSTSWTAYVSSTTNLRLERGSSQNVDADVAWQVVQFFKCAAVNDAAFAAVRAQTGLATVYWPAGTEVLILRKTSAFGSEAPANGESYAVDDTLGSATVVHIGSTGSFAQTGLTNGTTYHYKLFAREGGTVPCYATGATAAVNATPTAGTHPAWSYMMAGGSMLGPGIAGIGTLYTSSNSSRIISLDSSDGTHSWAPVVTDQPVQGWVIWLPPSGGGTPVVVAGDQSGKVYSVDTSTGATNWQPALSGADEVQAGVAAQLRSASDATFQATFTADVVFAATRNASATSNRVFALRATDGAVLWTFNGTGAYEVDYIVGMPFVDYARNRLYVTSRAGAGGTQNSLWVLDSLNGAVLAAYPLGHIETAPTLADSGNTLYVVNTAGDLYALNTATLAMKWTGPAILGSAVKGFVWEHASIPARLFFSTASGHVWCLQDPGSGSPPDPASPVWKTAVAGAATALPLDKLYVGSSDGRIHQLDLVTGADENQFTLGSTVGDLSTEDGNQLFAGTAAGKMYKIPLPLP